MSLTVPSTATTLSSPAATPCRRIILTHTVIRSSWKFKNDGKRAENKSAVVGRCGAVPNSNYVVPMDRGPSRMIRPLVEILRDLNKRVPDNIINPQDNSISWYHANRMLSFYAPGWCGEIRNVIFSDDGTVSVVYRVTIRGSDGEAHRESIGTVSSKDVQIMDPVAVAEEIAFCKACARFGLGLYLYHEDDRDAVES